MQTLERNYTKGLQYQYFLKVEKVFFWNNKLNKMLSWILKLNIIFLYKWYSEINHTTKKKKKSTQYSLQSIQHREKPFISVSSWCISCVMEKHWYIKRNELRKIKCLYCFPFINCFWHCFPITLIFQLFLKQNTVDSWTS